MNAYQALRKSLVRQQKQKAKTNAAQKAAKQVKEKPPLGKENSTSKIKKMPDKAKAQATEQGKNLQKHGTEQGLETSSPTKAPGSANNGNSSSYNVRGLGPSNDNSKGKGMSR